MALFSDVDWVILLAVAAFLLFGRENRQVLRTVGRWYARAGRMKQELLGEITKAADLPPPAPGQPLSIRGALLGLDPVPTRTSGIPAVVRTPPSAPPALPPTPPASFGGPTWTAGYPVPTWSTTVHPMGSEPEVRP